MVTAELAATIPVVVLLLAVALFGLRLGIDQVRCVDAARAGARAAARGDAPDRVRELALRAAPAGARVETDRAGSDVRVVVRAPAPGRLPLLDSLPGPTGSAVVRAEGAS